MKHRSIYLVMTPIGLPPPEKKMVRVFWVLAVFMLSLLTTSSGDDQQSPSVYELNKATGEFSAHLNATCTFKLEDSSYELKYEPTVKGVISKGRLRKLSGVSVKVMFAWLNIGEVRRNGGELEFSVGVATAGFLVSNFEECPQCGCGLDCGW